MCIKWITWSKLKGSSIWRSVEKEDCLQLMNNYPGKSEKLKAQGPLCALLCCFLFISSFLKFCGKHKWIFVLDAGHLPSYLQKLYCAACCAWDFEAAISRNICCWLLHLLCFIYIHVPNSYRIITSCYYCYCIAYFA